MRLKLLFFMKIKCLLRCLAGDLADASAELATRRNAESRHMQERSALLLQVAS